MNKTQSLQLLKTLINIDSQTNNKLGIKEIQGIIADELIAMGFEINWIKSTKNPHEFLLHAIKKSSSPNAKIVSFICHADTALSLKSFFQRTDDKIFGTGCADNKGGVVTGLLALKDFMGSCNSIAIDIHFLVSPNEEEGSVGFHDYLNEIGNISSVVMGLEPALINGNLIKSRSGNRWYEIKTLGIQAHSGRIGMAKLNSLHETILKAENVLKWATLHNIRLNFNSIETSSNLYNTVPKETCIKLDLRFENNNDRNIAHQKICAILETDHLSCETSFTKANSSFQVIDDCPAMEEKLTFSQHYFAIENLLKQVIKNDDLTLDHSWGAADISHMSFIHNLTIDGLGPVGAGMHREDEFIFIDSIYQRAFLITKILDYINTHKDFVTPRMENELNLQFIEQSSVYKLSSFSNAF